MHFYCFFYHILITLFFCLFKDKYLLNKFSFYHIYVHIPLYIYINMPILSHYQILFKSVNYGAWDRLLYLVACPPFVILYKPIWSAMLLLPLYFLNLCNPLKNGESTVKEVLNWLNFYFLLFLNKTYLYLIFNMWFYFILFIV